MGHTYIEDMKVHTYNFNCLIEGCNSADFAFVMLRDDGSLIGYAAPNIGVFNNIIVPEINKAEIIKKLEKKMREKYNYTKYEIDNNVLILNSHNKCEISFSVTLTIDDFKQGYTFNFLLE